MRKKLLAVVLCLMTAVAFMPTFAFADAVDETSYSLDWEASATTVDVVKTVKKGEKTTETILGSFDTAKKLNIVSSGKDAGKWDGTYTKYVPESEVIGSTMPEWWEAIPADKRANLKINDGVAVMDITGAKLALEGAKKFDEFANKATFEEYFGSAEADQYGDVLTSLKSEKGQAVKVVLTAPADAEGYSSLADKTCTLSAENALSALVTYDYDPSSAAAQEVVLTAVPKAKVTINHSEYDVIGDFTHTVKIDATAQDAYDADFYLDDASTVDNLMPKNGWIDAKALTYDGAAHTIVIDAVDGVTVSWTQVVMGKEVAVEKPEIKNAKEANYVFKATLRDAKNHKRVETINVKVNKANVKIGLKKSQTSKVFYEKAGTEIDPFDYIEAVGLDASSEAAIEADAALLGEWAKDSIEAVVKAQPKADTEKYEAYEVNYDAKAMTSEELKAYNKKYKLLNQNYFDKTVSYNPETITVYVAKAGDPVQKLDEIDFVAAPTKKTIHVKSAKALKKAKSFTVKAEAASAKAVSYKLVSSDSSKIKIGANTGKITLKKGLKKGTYKIKVKAYTVSDEAFLAAKGYQNITIKVKK